MRKLILASGSPRRKELLAQIVKDFEVMPSSYEEDMTLQMTPLELALHLSKGKAEDVAHQFEDAIILAADTFVVIEGEVLGKPKDKEDAKKMLGKESGKMQEVITGFTIIDSLSGKEMQSVVVSKVWFGNLTDEQIEEYVATYKVLDKAGSYAIQEIGDKFIERIEGSYTNIMGLPVEEVKEMLKEFGIDAY